MLAGYAAASTAKGSTSGMYSAEAHGYVTGMFMFAAIVVWLFVGLIVSRGPSQAENSESEHGSHL
jgi:hypothetical protein